MSDDIKNKKMKQNNQNKTIEMNKITTKMEIELDYNNDNNDKTQSNSTINPLIIDNQILNSKSFGKNNTTQRSRALSTNTKNIVENIVQNLSFRQNIRFGQFMILLIMLLISTGQFIIFHIYANVAHDSTYQKINRPFVWIFLLFTIVYLLRLVHVIATWKSNVENFIEDKYKIDEPNENTAEEQKISTISKIKTKYNEMSKYYDANFDINGKYYLHLLYFGEFTESWIQFNNLVQLYSCTLPIGWNITFILLLIIESSHRTKFMFQKIWGEGHIIHFNERNFQVVLDIAIDLFFLIVPLIILWFGYKIPMSIVEILQVILIPSLSLLLKLPTVFEQSMYNNIAREISSEQAQVSKKIQRKRKSLFGLSVNENVVINQNKYFPRYMKLVVFYMSLIYSLGLSSILIVQLAGLPQLDTCTSALNSTTIWNNGCVIKIPFCKRIFQPPKCNCAYLKIEKDYTLKQLPYQVTTKMDGLRKVYIRYGNLTELPNNMENLVNMVDFDISFTKLREFNVDVGKWKKLVKLYLIQDKLQRYNVNAIWKHQNIVHLSLERNIGLMPPRIQSKMASLQYLGLNDNNMTGFNMMDISTKFFPNLKFLFLSGNYLLNLPDKSLKTNLVRLGIARCNLTTIPSYMPEFKRLKYLDARDNRIQRVDDEFIELIKKNNIESYFAGNDVCKTDTRLDCDPLCSQQCWSRHVSKNGRCDIACDSEQCQYDGGDCTR